MPSDMHAEQTAPRPGEPGRNTRSAEAARQGRVVLGTPWRKTVFIAGLVGAGVLALLLGSMV